MRKAQVLGDDGRNGTGAAVGGLVAGDDQLDALDLTESSSQGVRRLDGVGAVEGRVVEVDGLVGAHGQRLADGIGRAIGTGGEHGDLATVALLDEQSLFDGPLVDLVEHGVRSFAVEGVVAVGELALGPRVGGPA